MDLKDLLQAIRRSPWLILALTVVGIAGAVVAIVTTRPQYQSDVQLFVSAPDSGTDLQGAYQGGLFTQQRVLSYADIVNSSPVLSPVIGRLRLDEDAATLAKHVTAKAPDETVLVNVAVTDGRPARAQAIANAVAAQFITYVGDLERPAGGGAPPVKVSVSKPASQPESPVSPRKSLYLLFGLLAGLAVGLGAALLRHTLDTSVKELSDIAGPRELAPLGIVPFDGSAGKSPLVAHGALGSARAEAFRQLRTNLQFVDVGHTPRSIVVTSAVPGEGKSSTVCNLAWVLAQAGVSVCVVEADLRLPALSRYLGVPGHPGLTDVLVGRVGVGDALRTWTEREATVSVLPAGTLPPMPSELLASKRMASVVDELEARFDIVLLDAPPLLPVTDAAVLSHLADGAIMVVRQGKTTKAQATRALEMLEHVDARVYGVVLNMAAGTSGEYSSYGSYGSPPEPEALDEAIVPLAFSGPAADRPAEPEHQLVR